MAQQTEQQESKQRVEDAAASLNIPREWVNDSSQGLSPWERFERGHDAPRYYPASQQQQEYQQHQQQYQQQQRR